MSHWIDNADSYICPKCRFEVANPNYYKGKCPNCGFQDKKNIDELASYKRQVIDDRAFEKNYNIEWYLGNGKIKTCSAVLTDVRDGFIFFRYPSGGIFIIKKDAIRSLDCLE